MSEFDVKDCCYYNSDNEPYCCELYDNECEAQNCYYKQFQQLKAENELYKQAHKTEQDHRRKFEQCLDEIEEIVNKEICCVNSEITCCELCDRIEEIKQKIKKVKDNE